MSQENEQGFSEEDGQVFGPFLDRFYNVSHPWYPNDTTYPDEHDHEFLFVKSVVDLADYILFAFSFPGLFFNLIVLGSSYKLHKNTSDPTHILVASRTFADLLICVSQQLRIVLQHFVCIGDNVTSMIHMSLAWTGYSASGISLFLLNVEKLLYFHWPLHYEMVVTTKKTSSAILASWVVCVLYTVVMLLTAYLCEDEYCIVPHSIVYRIYIIFFSIVPVLSSGMLSVYLCITVQTKRHNEFDKVSFTQQIKTMLFIFVSSAWAVVSFVLARFHFLFFIESVNSVLVWFGFVTNYLLLLNPFVNPILTIIVYPCYRNMLINCIRCKKNKLSNKLYETVETDGDGLPDGQSTTSSNNGIMLNGLYTMFELTSF